MEVADLLFQNPQLPMMIAVKRIVTPEECQLHGHRVSEKRDPHDVHYDRVR